MNQSDLQEIVGAIADTKGVAPEELDIALQRHVSTDAIRFLRNHESDSWCLEFETPNHVVELTGEGSVHVDGEYKRTLT